jgi:hypothetical protein
MFITSHTFCSQMTTVLTLTTAIATAATAVLLRALVYTQAAECTAECNERSTATLSTVSTTHTRYYCLDMQTMHTDCVIHHCLLCANFMQYAVEHCVYSCSH